MIDIIIPAYNAHKTIIGTLYSIINQKNVFDLNVLIVDDNSDENYDEVCYFFSKYVSIRTIRLEQNGGPGIARQKGLENSSGEFIVFVDADDELYDEYSLLNLYNAMQENDISYGKIYFEHLDSIKYHDVCLHGKMYRRDFLEKNDIKFNNYRSHEDNAFNQLCLSLSKKINCIDNIVYKYNYTKDSITNTIEAKDNFHLLVKSMSWLFENIEKNDEINENHVGKVIVSIIHYLYFCYINNNELNFLFKELGYLKEMFFKYKKYVNYEDELKSFKQFEISAIPEITFNEFLDNIQ